MRAVTGAILSGGVTVGVGLAHEVSNFDNERLAAAEQLNTNPNSEEYWERLGYGECTKVENPGGETYFLGVAPNGSSWTYIRLKSASEQSAEDPIIEDYSPNANTTYGPIIGNNEEVKKLSYVLTCYEMNGSTTTINHTTTTVGSSTTSVVESTSTLPNSTSTTMKETTTTTDETTTSVLESTTTQPNSTTTVRQTTTTEHENGTTTTIKSTTTTTNEGLTTTTIENSTTTTQGKATTTVGEKVTTTSDKKGNTTTTSEPIVKTAETGSETQLPLYLGVGILTLGATLTIAARRKPA